MPRCAVGVGGNLGDVARSIAAAFERLAATDGVSDFRGSRLYETAPVGERAGTGYRNAACTFETTLSPLAVLKLLREVESTLGRERSIYWGPRTIDLDLIFYGDESIHLPGLRVPHPAAWYRRFVLDPLAELAPDWVHPALRLTVAQLLKRLDVRPLPVVVSGSLVGDISMNALAEEFPQVAFDGSAPERAAMTFAAAGPGHVPVTWVEPLRDMALDLSQIRLALVSALDRPHPSS